MSVLYAIDVGTRKVAGVVAKPAGNKLKILAYTQKVHLDRSLRDGEVVDIPATAQHIREITNRLEEKLSMELKTVALAAAGKNLRSVEHSHTMRLSGEITQVTLHNILMEALALAPTDPGWLVGYSVKGYEIDGQPVESPLYMLGDNLTIRMILTYLPKRTVYALTKAANLAGLKVGMLTLEPIASLTSTLPERFRFFNIGVVDIGGGTTDVSVVREGKIVGYGSTDVAGDELTEVIASTYLLPFPKAERVKIRLFSGEKQIAITNMFGEKIQLEREEVLNICKPTIEKIAQATAQQIKTIAKKPAAVILVGGAARTPTLKESLASALELPLNRIGIKYPMSSPFGILPRSLSDPRWAVALGILILASKKEGVIPINIEINGNPISIPTPKPLTVQEVLQLAGLDNHKPVNITVIGQPVTIAPQITINGRPAEMTYRIKDGDKITVTYANLTAEEIIRKLVPQISLNGREISINWQLIDKNTSKPVKQVKNGGHYIISPSTIGELLQHLGIPNSAHVTAETGNIVKLIEPVILYRQLNILSSNGTESPQDEFVLIKVGDVEKKIPISSGEMIASILSRHPELVDMVSKGRLVSILVNGKPATFTTRVTKGDVVEINTG